MKSKGKLFGLLAVLGIVAAFFVVPYMQDLLGESLMEQVRKLGIEQSTLEVLIVLQSAVMYIFCALVGVIIYARAGFKMPVFENLLGMNEEKVQWKSWLAWSLGGGLLVGGTVVLGDYIFLQLGSPLSLFESALPVWWKGLLGAVSAGIGEELMFRLFLLTLLTLMLSKILKGKKGLAVGVSIFFVAVVFGIMHLPATMAIVQLTPLVLVRALLLNGIGGIVFGFLYWKKGLESAMLAHFITDTVVHGLLQLFVSFRADFRPFSFAGLRVYLGRQSNKIHREVISGDDWRRDPCLGHYYGGAQRLVANGQYQKA